MQYLDLAGANTPANQRFRNQQQTSLRRPCKNTAAGGPRTDAPEHSGAFAYLRVIIPSAPIFRISQTMTDIAFDPSGNLWGISFSSIYTIDKTTGAATLVGNHGISSGNALAFSATGTLYAAGATTTNLYTVNTGSGAGSLVGNMGFSSGGDLAFNGGNLYLASPTQLVRVNAGSGAGALVGSFGVSDVFGLATGDNGVLYATAGRSVFTVNTTSGAATLATTWSAFSPTLGTAFGTAFVTEAGAPPETSVPEPGTLLLIAAGLIGIVSGRRRAPLR